MPDLENCCLGVFRELEDFDIISVESLKLQKVNAETDYIYIAFIRLDDRIRYARYEIAKVTGQNVKNLTLPLKPDRYFISILMGIN